MKLPSARSRRASAPLRNTNLAPETFAARAKSICSIASPRSKCSLAALSSRWRAEAPRNHLDIFVFAGAIGNIGIRKVGKCSKRSIKRGFQRAFLFLAFLDAFPQARRFAHQRCRAVLVLLRFRRADLARNCIATGLRFLQTHLHRAQIVVAGEQIIGDSLGRRQTPTRETLSE